jgi:hypothetical protein
MDSKDSIGRAFLVVRHLYRSQMTPTRH